MREYFIYCDACGHRGIVNENPEKFGEQGYYRYETSKCPARIPYKDPETQKIVNPESIKLMPKFRCPGCGRAISARKIQIKKDENRGKNKVDGCEDGVTGPEIPPNSP